ncbi:MAG: UPF0182 family membrane protein [Methanotrichaceae archaeon]
MKLKYGLVAPLAFLLIFSGQIVYVLTEWRWFGSVGYSNVFTTMITAKFALFLATALIFGAVSFINLSQITERPRHVFWIVIAISVLFGLVVAQVGWDKLLLALNVQTFYIQDPLFQKDVGFYVFTLPFLWILWDAVFATVLINLIITAGIYFFVQADRVLFQEPIEYAEIARMIPGKVQSHIAALLGVLAVLFSIRYLLSRFDLLYSDTGVVYGAGYADVHAHLPFLYICAGVAILVAVLLFAFTAGRRSSQILILTGVIIVATAGLGAVYPAMVQQYKVSPNEIVMEEPFIIHNINYTLQAYGLSNIDETTFPVDYNLTRNDLRANSATIDNVRLWDWRPLLKTYKQLQEIRLYYEFFDVDVDRYTIDGKNRQVMLSARELSQNQLPEQSQTWLNQHLIYTHGYGICMSPANVVTPEGLPDFYVKNLPPESSIWDMKRPEIYYGEGSKDYLVVNTELEEFDYPLGDENVRTIYTGSGGIKLDFFTKLLMSYRLGSLKLLMTDYITNQSRIMIHRNILDRANTIAPFLTYDDDPYIVFANSRLYWVIDAYTLTDRYPYSEPLGRFNYIRNPVKVVINAYDGEIKYYVVEEDPILQAYMAIYPDLFSPQESMPSELRAHMRYPVDLFSVQAQIYKNYHMKDPQVFYNREDSWDVSTEVYQEHKQTMDPYYVIMKTPGSESEEEFMLIQPFTPRSKNNMIAWMCAKSDQPNYGNLMIFKFPKDQLTFGPMQVEARIDQDTEISEQLTLWSQKGSSVIRGNMLVIPINNSLLYVEPLYLQAENSELPELKRVIVAYSGNVAMEDSLDLALAEIFDLNPVTRTKKERSELSTEELIQQAVTHYQSAQDLLRAGNWSGYGEETGMLGEVLQDLEARSRS